MTKKKALVLVEFDDPEDDFTDTTHFAQYIAAVTGELKGGDVTVYANPGDLMADIDKGYSIFAPGNSDAVELPVEAETSTGSVPKP